MRRVELKSEIVYTSNQHWFMVAPVLFTSVHVDFVA